MDKIVLVVTWKDESKWITEEIFYTWDSMMKFLSDNKGKIKFYW